ncbi:TPA: hypothetical protein ACGOV5_001613, partial [Streptococcus suis]
NIFELYFVSRRIFLNLSKEKIHFTELTRYKKTEKDFSSKSLLTYIRTPLGKNKIFKAHRNTKTAGHNRLSSRRLYEKKLVAISSLNTVYIFKLNRN